MVLLNTSLTTSTINASINKISIENKTCMIWGDFSVNLLNFDSHQQTDEFLSV